MDGKKPYLVVILVQSIYGGMFMLSKAAFNGGMNNYVFVFYRQAAATLFLAPFAFYFEWKNRPPLSFVTFCKIFFLALFGISLSLDISGIGIVYANATLAAAISNCLPVVTFFLALLLRMEVLKFRTVSGIAKIAGIVACIAGADKGLLPLVLVQYFMGLMARVAGKGFEKLPIKASFRNSSVLSKHNSAICHCRCC
ncbi:WAT1-RELATED PROTEIN [Salix koriyanagi]|uniref:WAT1-related protein n=1 Tax=Salix koriyanagi TaxID=2511006 RepID=A0A9Q1AN63_9ROSI|nr:WAT1-RELATED PROTEIN [Salix koriyanagi]